MEDKTLVVPMDKQGMVDYEEDITKTDRLKYFTLPAQEFQTMMRSGFFDRVNSAFELLIDDYEEEIIPGSALTQVKKLITDLKLKCPCFLAALDYAIGKETELCLEF